MADEAATTDLEERVRQFLRAQNCGDFDALAAMFAPNAVWDTSSLGLARTFESRETIRRAWEDWFGSFEASEIVLEEFRDLGDGVTLVGAVQRVRPIGSSGVVEARFPSVATWLDGLIERWTTYTDIAEARAAAERLVQERR
jgi:ketosteroid isomerase-like protein